MILDILSSLLNYIVVADELDVEYVIIVRNMIFQLEKL